MCVHCGCRFLKRVPVVPLPAGLCARRGRQCVGPSPTCTMTSTREGFLRSRASRTTSATLCAALTLRKGATCGHSRSDQRSTPSERTVLSCRQHLRSPYVSANLLKARRYDKCVLTSMVRSPTMLDPILRARTRWQPCTQAATLSATTPSTRHAEQCRS